MTVSILAEIPESLHQSLQTFLQTHPEWDQDRAFCTALGQFLMVSLTSDTPEGAIASQGATKAYMDGFFGEAA